MIKITKILTINFILILVCSLGSYALTNFSVTGGIVLPNSNMSNIFNNNGLNTTDSLNPNLDVMKPNSKAGYSINAKLSFELTDDAMFWSGFSLIRFSKSEYELQNPNDGSYQGFIEAISSIYPISAGINYYFFDKFISVYGIGSLSYNFISNSFITSQSKMTVILPRNNTDNRLGYCIGLGFEIPFEKTSIIIESTYNDFNYIGKGKGEDLKSSLNFGAGIRF